MQFVSQMCPTAHRWGGLTGVLKFCGENLPPASLPLRRPLMSLPSERDMISHYLEAVSQLFARMPNTCLYALTIKSDDYPPSP